MSLLCNNKALTFTIGTHIAYINKGNTKSKMQKGRKNYGSQGTNTLIQNAL